LVAGPVLGVSAAGEATDGRLGSVGLVLDAPGLDNDMGFEQRTELLDVQECLADGAIKDHLCGAVELLMPNRDRGRPEVGVGRRDLHMWSDTPASSSARVG
jgi:hypothetical protein